MKLYLLVCTEADADDREYFMPWYSDHFLFNSLENRKNKIKELMSMNEYLSEENFYETELEITE